MSKPKEKANAPASFPRKAVTCVSGPSDEERGEAYAGLITSSALSAYRIIAVMQRKTFSEGLDSPTFMETLHKHAEAVQRGDMSYAEAMLSSQASALQSVFVRLSEKAMEQNHMPNLEGFMRLELRAQSQCRTTLDALASTVLCASRWMQCIGDSRLEHAATNSQ